MEEKGNRLENVGWPIVSLWIDPRLTALQGDTRLAAAPFTPGALLVSNADLGHILGPMEELTLVHGPGGSDLVQRDLNNPRAKKPRWLEERPSWTSTPLHYSVNADSDCVKANQWLNGLKGTDLLFSPLAALSSLQIKFQVQLIALHPDLVLRQAPAQPQAARLLRNRLNLQNCRWFKLSWDSKEEVKKKDHD